MRSTITIDLPLVIPAEAWVFGIPEQVMTDIEVEVTIAVQVGEGGRGRPIAITPKSGRLRHVPEGSVPLVTVQRVSAPAGDEEIGMAIAVIITDGHAV